MDQVVNCRFLFFFLGRISWLKLQAHLRHSMLLQLTKCTTLMEVMAHCTHRPIQILIMLVKPAAMAQFMATIMVIELVVIMSFFKTSLPREPNNHPLSINVIVLVIRDLKDKLER